LVRSPTAEPRLEDCMREFVAALARVRKEFDLQFE
jgi:hypothetical protein